MISDRARSFCKAGLLPGEPDPAEHPLMLTETGWAELYRDDPGAASSQARTASR